MLTQDMIDDAWEEVNNLDESEGILLASRFEREQPELFKYIATVSDTALKEPNKEDLIYYSIIAWKALLKSGHSYPKVSRKFLYMAQEEQAGKIGRLIHDLEDGVDVRRYYRTQG